MKSALGSGAGVSWLRSARLAALRRSTLAAAGLESEVAETSIVLRDVDERAPLWCNRQGGVYAHQHAVNTPCIKISIGLIRAWL